MLMSYVLYLIPKMVLKQHEDFVELFRRVRRWDFFRFYIGNIDAYPAQPRHAIQEALHCAETH